MDREENLDGDKRENNNDLHPFIKQNLIQLFGGLGFVRVQGFIRDINHFQDQERRNRSTNWETIKYLERCLLKDV